MSFKYKSKNQFYNELKYEINNKFDKDFNFKDDLKIMLSLMYYYSEKYYDNYKEYGVMLPTEIVLEFTRQFDSSLQMYKIRLVRLLCVIYQNFHCMNRLYKVEYMVLSSIFPKDQLGEETKKLFLNKG